jgi:hypothetical protein
LKPSPTAAAYDCEYSGYFQSGTLVGPLRNGAPCRSSVANDSLEGIQVRLIKRQSAVLPEAARKAGAAPSGASKRAPAADPKKPLPAANRGADTGARSARREPIRRP